MVPKWQTLTQQWTFTKFNPFSIKINIENYVFHMRQREEFSVTSPSLQKGYRDVSQCNQILLYREKEIYFI